MRKLIALSVIWFLLCIFIALKCAHAEQTGARGASNAQDKQIVSCIVGEGANQGEIGMYALASAILNRIDGMGYDKALRGVYGCHAKHNQQEPQYIWERGYYALAKARIKRLHEADHWENIKAFKRPQWAYKMKLVYQYKDHWFYKDVK